MHNIKRLFGAFLALFLIFNILVVPVSAVEVGGGTNTEITQPSEEEEKESSWFASFREKLKLWFDNLSSSISDLNTTLNNSISNLKLAMSGWFDNLSSSIGGFFSDLTTSMSTWFSNLKKSFTDMSDSIGGWFSDLGDDLKGWFSNLRKSITDFSDTVGNWFDNFFDDLGEEIKSWFVPEEEVLSQKYEEFRSDLPFIDSILSFGEDLNTLFNTSSYSDDVNYPKITMDLSAATSKYNYGGKAVVLDLSWYAKYKPYVDIFLSAFLWMAYLWLLFKRLPDIIGGAGMVTEANVFYNNSKNFNVTKKKG